MNNLAYKFEPMVDGMYQVRLNGEFVCYSENEDSAAVDNYLFETGFTNRVDYLEYRLKQYSK